MGLGQSRAPAPPVAAELSRQAAAQTAAPPGHVALASLSIHDMAAAAAAASRTSHEFQAEVRRRICGRDGSENPQEESIWGMFRHRAPTVTRALTLLELADTSRDNPARLFRNMPRREMSESFCTSAAASVTLGELEADAHPTRGLAVLLSACETEEEKAHVRTTVLYALWLIHNAEYGALSQALCAACQRLTREYMAEGDRRMAELLRNAAEEKKKKKKPAAKKKPAKKPTVQKKPAKPRK